MGWISVPDGYGARAIPCDVCHRQGAQDYFDSLEILDGNREAIALARAFAAKPSGWLVLVGDVGTGKTRLLNGILSQWVNSPRQALTSSDLLELWRGAMDMDNLGPVFNGYCASAALILDDLGAERVTDWTVERLTMLLNFRYGRALPTAIATNLDRQGLEQRLGSRIADRVYDEGTGLVRIARLDVPSFRRLGHE